MGNLITYKAAGLVLPLSNGATAVLVSVLALAGAHRAETEWEHQLMVWLAEHDHGLRGLGCVGFDLADIAWTREGFQSERAFLLLVIDTALARYRWDALGYDPPFAEGQLLKLREMVCALRAEDVATDEPWRFWSEVDLAARCPVHRVHVHGGGCVICNDV